MVAFFEMLPIISSALSDNGNILRLLPFSGLILTGRCCKPMLVASQDPEILPQQSNQLCC
jgi:hypothetical protein